MVDQNLWGDLDALPKVTTPGMILESQANLLDRATNGALNAIVQRFQIGGQFRLELLIVAPFLDNYRFEILSVSHGPELYPLVIEMSSTGRAYDVADETELIGILREILGSTEVKKVISSLVSDSQGSRDLV